MYAPDTDYVSYLLRLWRSDEDDCWAWRASLESVQTGEKLHFGSVSLLIVCLEKEFSPCEKEIEQEES